MLTSAITCHKLGVTTEIIKSVHYVELLHQVYVVIHYGCTRQLQHVLLTLSDTLHKLRLLGAAGLTLVALINDDGAEQAYTLVKVNALECKSTLTSDS